MSHNMRADPRNTLCFHVIGKRATKIEPVTMFPLDNIGLEDVWRAKAVAIEKIGKLIRERHSAGIAAFRGGTSLSLGSRLFRSNIEPLGYRFDTIRIS